MSISFARLFDPLFIFNPVLNPMHSWLTKILYILFSLSVIISIILKIMSVKQAKNKNLPAKKLLQKLTNFFATLGILGLLLTFIRQARAYFISMPLFFYIFILAMLIWLFFIMRWNFTKKKQLVDSINAKKAKEKYL